MKTDIQFELMDNTSEKAVRDLTALLNLCYKNRFQSGVYYLPDGQDEETTRRRISGKEVWFAKRDQTLIGTFTLATSENASGTWWYRQPGVSEICQIAVHPAFQRQGYFSILMDFAEKRALELGSLELAGSVPAKRKWLIRAYLKRGTRIVDYKWKNNASYGSVIFSKSLGKSSLKSGFFRRSKRKLKYFRRFLCYKFSKNTESIRCTKYIP